MDNNVFSRSSTYSYELQSFYRYDPTRSFPFSSSGRVSTRFTSTVNINGQTGNLEKQSALVLSCIAKYYCALRDGHLPALGVNMGKHFVPLDMGQFKNLGWFSHRPFSPLVGRSSQERAIEENHNSLYNQNTSNRNGQASCARSETRSCRYSD